MKDMKESNTDQLSNLNNSDTPAAAADINLTDPSIKIRPMTMEDFDQVHALWMTIHGFGIRSIDDAREGVERFLKRNPGCSVVAERTLAAAETDGNSASGNSYSSIEEKKATGNKKNSSKSRKEIVGSILCGHDGRTACLYHVSVREDLRRHGIGKAMVLACMRALQKEKVSKISLVAFQSNIVGNEFWNAEGWTRRTDLNQYEFVLNEENIVRFNG